MCHGIWHHTSPFHILVTLGAVKDPFLVYSRGGKHEKRRFMAPAFAATRPRDPLCAICNVDLIL